MEGYNPRLERRIFLKAAAMGLACVSVASLREALARADVTGKPVFTAGALNDWLDAERGRDSYARIHQAASGRRLKELLRENFTFTAEQDAELETFKDHDRARDFVASAVKNKARMRVALRRAAGRQAVSWEASGECKTSGDCTASVSVKGTC